MRRAIFPATFDPPTLGHVDLARRAAAVFDELIMAVYATPQKAAILFPIEQRLELVREAVRDLPNVRAVSYHSLTIDFAREVGAQVIVRGLRVVSDFEWEFQMALTNQRLAPEIETICLMARAEYSFLSSSIVKEVAKHGGALDRLVPVHVARALQRAYAARPPGRT
ncbi:MAG: pantetheine-phosphate adenylyltransferase [Chloroflexi bacterium]|nr:pantetheine-phosphate adenylyltransferase [Chloroflexota bacterium]